MYWRTLPLILRGRGRLDQRLDEFVFRSDDDRLLLELLVRGVEGVLQFLLVCHSGVLEEKDVFIKTLIQTPKGK